MSQHISSQHGIHSRQMPFAVRPEPFQHIFVHAQGNGLLCRTGWQHQSRILKEGRIEFGNIAGVDAVLRDRFDFSQAFFRDRYGTVSVLVVSPCAPR